MNKPQTLSQGQREEVTGILRKQVLLWTLAAFGLLTGVTGVGLWQIYKHVESKMERLVAAQFDEPRIRGTVQEVAATRAGIIITKQVQPEVARFKAEVATQLGELERLVSKTKDLEQQSHEHGNAIQTVLGSLRNTLAESQQMRDKMVGLQSDVIKMQKCVTKIQYYTLKGRNTFPNPYHKDMVDALNELVSIAIPDPSERSKFIKELGGPQL